MPVSAIHESVRAASSVGDGSSWCASITDTLVFPTDIAASWGSEDAEAQGSPNKG